MKTGDIESRKDIELLVTEFYKEVIKDDVIGYLFTEVAALDFDKHLPVMFDFWETTLLGNLKYKGNPMAKHVELSHKSPLSADHFERWLLLWEQTLTRNFNGPKTEEALSRAKQIASLMQFKIQQYSHK